MPCRSLIACFVLVYAASTPGLEGAASAAQSSPGVAAQLVVQSTEEGQRVVYDGYTWQRRELAKRLPLAEPWPDEARIAQAFARFGLDRLPVPELLPAPSRILTDVYLVNNKPNLTYLIDAGEKGLILVDPGLESNVDTIISNVEKLGFSRKSVRWIINTHAHFDHSMADAAFKRLGAKILIGRADASAVEKGTGVTAKYMLPDDQRASYPSVHVDWLIDDGEELRLGNKLIHAIRTPGHTDGSTCFLMTIDGRNILFSGDTLLFDYRLGTQNTPYSDNIAYAASLRKLAWFTLNGTDRVRWDVLLPGHGTIVVDRAHVDVLKAWRQVQIDLANGEPVEMVPFATYAYRAMMLGRP